jgi:hypothetical protein
MMLRRSLPAVIAIAVAFMTICAPSDSYAQTGPYVRIEQDWEMMVKKPEPSLLSPQVYIQMSPFPSSSVGGIFLLNYRDTPSFEAGGLQLQLWDSDRNIGLRSFGNGGQLNLNAEQITWTQYMELKAGNLNFGIMKIRSKTWGNSGASDNWSVTTPYSAIKTFTDSYQTTDSLEQSGILFGASNVTSLKLQQVRKYDAGGKYDTETNSQQVYP